MTDKTMKRCTANANRLLFNDTSKPVRGAIEGSQCHDEMSRRWYTLLTTHRRCAEVLVTVRQRIKARQWPNLDARGHPLTFVGNVRLCSCRTAACGSQEQQSQSLNVREHLEPED